MTDVPFSVAVKAAQARRGSRNAYARVESKRGWPDAITPELAALVARLDTFFLATASAGGQPYVQHRGGPAGFLKVTGPRTLGFADYEGNRQYISVGNLSENDRVMLLLIDFETRARVKVWGTARVVEDDAAVIAAVDDPRHGAKARRAVLIDVVAWDENCSRHITARVRDEDCARRVAALEARVVELEAQLQPNSGA